MNVFLPGTVSKFDDIDTGSLVLFKIQHEFHLGIIVTDPDGDRAIVDFEGDDKQNGQRFQIYRGHAFANDGVLHLSKARIVPDLSQDSVGYGRPDGEQFFRSLYLSQTGHFIVGFKQPNTYKINLQTGTVVNTDPAHSMHAKRWRIEVEDGTGSFKLLREISA